jgi:hypothetical protein
MDSIYQIENLLSLEEKEFLLKEAKKIDDGTDLHNYNQIDKNLYLIEFQKKVNEFLLKAYPTINYKFGNIWINKITADRLDSLEYHIDDSDLTIITYLNSDFTGGDFEYILNNKNNKIKVKENMCIVMDKTLQHRIAKVTNGNRYSLALFLYKDYQKINLI